MADASPLQVEAVDPNDPASQPSSAPPQTDAEDQETPPTAAPPEQPAASATLPGAGSEVDKAFKEEQAANTAGAKAIGEQGAAEAKAQQQATADLQALPSQNDIITKYADRDNQLSEAFANKTIDPDRFYANLGTGQRISAGIGLLLSGFGSGASGQPNLAANMLENAVNRDIDAQKNAQGQAMTLWKMNREAMGSDLAANLATQNQMLLGLQSKLNTAASQAKGPIALANSQHANALIAQQVALNHQKLSLLEPSGDVDPATRIGLLQRFGMATPEQAKGALEETKNRTNVAANGDKMLAAFDQAAKEQRTLGSGYNPIDIAKNLKNAIPGVNSQGVDSLHQLMLPNFKSIDGTVRQAAMDESFHNVTPRFGDSDQRVAQRRQAFVDWIESEKAAPVAKSLGVNLDHYKSTSWTPSAPAATPPPGSNTIGGKPASEFKQVRYQGKIYNVPVK